ncbi:hypothetical protein Tco_0805047 [Tanacetum coccineum]
MKDNGVIRGMSVEIEENVEVENIHRDEPMKEMRYEYVVDNDGDDVVEGVCSNRGQNMVNNTNDCTADGLHKNDKNSEDLNKPKSYAKKVTNNMIYNDNKLFTIPTGINKNGEEVVTRLEMVLDDENRLDDVDLMLSEAENGRIMGF